VRYSVSVATHTAFGSLTAPRLLVPEPRRVATLRDARAWLSRMAATWIGALLPHEDGFTGSVLDEDGSAALAVEYGTDPDAEPLEHDRAALREMKTMTTRRAIP
jgi:hypothetical protein